MNEHAESLSLKEQIAEDWRCNGRDWRYPGFRAIAVHRLGEHVLGKSGFKNKLAQKLYWILFRHVRNHYGIEIMTGAKIGRRFKIAHQGAIVIHCSSTIGDDCLIRQGVTLGAASARTSDDAPTLEDGVELGAGAMVLGDIVVGRHSKLGCNVVLTESVPEYAVVVVDKPSIRIKKPEMTNAA